MSKATQRLYLVGKVLSAKIKETEGKEVEGVYKKGNVQYSAFIKLPNGTAITLRKRVWESDKAPSDYTIKKVAEFESIVERLKNKETILLGKFIAPNKEDGSMFDWVTSYTNNDEKTSYTIDGFGNLVNFTEEESGQIFIHQKNKDVLFSDLSSEIYATMYISDTYDNKIVLTDGEEDYPNELLIELTKEPKNPPKIGQGYKFTLAFERGETVSKEAVESELDFDEEAKTEFAPDRLVVKKVGKIDGMVLEGVSEDVDLADF